MWIVFGRYKWAYDLVELAKDDLPVGMSLLDHLHMNYGAYRWTT